MGKRYLIDTNILIEYIGKILPGNAHAFVTQVIDEEFNISVINQIEVLGHNTAGKDIESFIELATVFGLDNKAISKTIDLRKNHKVKLPDCIIAATAIVNDFTLVSRNEKDFKGIPGLDLVNPYSL